MAQNLITMITLFVNNNKQNLDSDGFLSFEDVKSIELTPRMERRLKAHWIDGVQLKEDGNVDVWLSTYLSEEMFAMPLKNLPKSLYIPLLDKIASAIADKTTTTILSKIRQ